MSRARPTQMVLERVGRAIDFVESRLKDDLDLHETVARSGYSRTHFQRLFRAVVGLTVAEYVRRRRLCCAAEELVEGRSVLDTAIDWGYGSQAAFTRAFSRSYGVAPAAYARGVRAGASPVDVLPAYRTRVSSHRELLVEPVRVEKPALPLAGLARRETAGSPETFRSVTALWADWYASERWRPLGSSPWAPTYGLNRVFSNGSLEYLVAVEAGGRLPRGYRTVHLAAQPYAVFEADGVPAETAPALVLAAYGEWSADLGMERRTADWHVELFRQAPGLPADAMHCELWVPLKA